MSRVNLSGLRTNAWSNSQFKNPRPKSGGFFCAPGERELPRVRQNSRIAVLGSRQAGQSPRDMDVPSQSLRTTHQCLEQLPIQKPSPKKRGFFLRTRRARTPASSTKQQDSCFGQPSGWAKPEGHGCPESISPDYAPMLGATPNSKNLAQKAGVFCMAHLGSDKMAGQPFWTAVRLGAVPRGKDAPSH